MPEIIPIPYFDTLGYVCIFCIFGGQTLAGEFNPSHVLCAAVFPGLPGLIGIGFWPDLGWTGSSGFRVVPMDGKATRFSDG